MVLEEDEEFLTHTLNDIIEKDIIWMHNITEKRVVFDLLRALATRVGKPTSMNMLSRILGVSLDTVRRFLSYFEEVFLIQRIDRCSKSYNERVASPKKFYFLDLGMLRASLGRVVEGAAFENAVFLKLKDKDPCYYLEDGVEIDFFAGGKFYEAKYGRPPTEKQMEILKKRKGLLIDTPSNLLENV